MKNYYVDSNSGLDTNNGLSKDKPFKTLMAMLSSITTFTEDTTIYLGSGRYTCDTTLVSKIPANITLSVVGLGAKTKLMPTTSWGGMYSNASPVGVKNSTLNINRLIFDMIYMNTNNSAQCMNNHFNLNNVVILNPIQNPHGCFVPYNGSIYTFKNCLSLGPGNVRARLDYGSMKIYNSYGLFGDGYASSPAKWNIENNVITETPLVNSKYKIIDESVNSSIGLHTGEYTWHGNALLKQKGEYYSIDTDFYNEETKTYRPLTESEMNSKFLLFDLFDAIILGNENSAPNFIMKSNTEPAPYTVSASSFYSSGYDPWKVFDGLNFKQTEAWFSASGTSTPQWIQLDYGAATKINAFEISSSTDVYKTGSPKDFSLQGSNDGTTFDTIKSFANETNWTEFETRRFYLDTEVEYRYYRILIDTNNGHGFKIIGELKFLYLSPIREKFKPIDKFDNFNILLLGQEQFKINCVKEEAQLVVASDDIPSYLATNTLNFIVSTNKINNGQLRLAVSVDKGTTWKSHDGINFIDLGITIPLKEYTTMTPDEIVLYESAKNEIANNGISYELFNTLNFDELKSQDIRFAYVLIRPKYTDVIETDQLDWRFEAIGSLTKMKKIDYTNKVYSNGITFICKSETPILKMDVMANQVEKL